MYGQRLSRDKLGEPLPPVRHVRFPPIADVGLWRNLRLISPNAMAFGANCDGIQMKPLYWATAPLTFAATLWNTDIAAARPAVDPFSFFEGLTDTVGTLKILMHSPVHTHCISRGELRSDGSLRLIQRVEDEGNQPYLRRWLVRQIAPGHFVGTMSQATGPVTIDEVGDRYRFRFRMSGGLSVEEWLTPLPGGRSAESSITVHKFGIPVASSEGMVRKIS